MEHRRYKRNTMLIKLIFKNDYNYYYIPYTNTNEVRVVFIQNNTAWGDCHPPKIDD